MPLPKEKMEMDECMVCHNKAKHQVGLPGQRVSLCGIHINQLKRLLGYPFGGVGMLSKKDIRRAFGFIFP
jgi:hypothetical protein